ncbi:MAG: hypothetical protein DYH03_02540 [Nitrospira sp. NTP1]|nr:hypothetical protein [Nitrospira sp. NTP1]
MAGYTGRSLAMAGGIIGLAAVAAYFGIAHIGEPDQGGGSIAGQVQIAPNLADAKRFDGPKFPVQFEITNDDVMVKGSELKGMVDVIARLDRDGQAGPPQPGDIEGRYPKNPTLPGGKDVNITIDKVY